MCNSSPTAKEAYEALDRYLTEERKKNEIKEKPTGGDVNTNESVEDVASKAAGESKETKINENAEESSGNKQFIDPSKSNETIKENDGSKQDNDNSTDHDTSKDTDGNTDSTPTSDKKEIEIEYPEFIEGQRIGAVLKVKYLPPKSSADAETSIHVDDHLQILAFNEDPSNGEVRVKNLRTGQEKSVSWDIFFPVPYHGKCGCLKGQGECRCVYETREEFVANYPCTCTSNEPIETAGQTINSILVVKQHPYHTNQSTLFELALHVDIGDRVQILNFCEGDAMKVMGRNLRTKGVGYLRWDAFRPVGVRKMCACPFAKCDCEYLDFKASREFEKEVREGGGAQRFGYLEDAMI